MCKFFLHTKACDVREFSDFCSGMLSLNSIDRGLNSFFKHESIYELHNYSELWKNSTQNKQNNQTISRFIEQLKKCEQNLITEQQARDHWGSDDNAFLGIDFTPTSISLNKQIKNNDDFNAFLGSLQNINTYNEFWQKKEKVFPALIFCPGTENNIRDYGNKKIFNQIKSKLKSLNDSSSDWTFGRYDYKKANANFPLNISPESKQTMNQYKNERTFQLPEGGTRIFELHVKTGNLRIHFSPDENKRRIYVGYIGPHLPTVTFK